ncbi:hypothetical protein OPV22_003509 [Ensete ventricosum]|uniref:Secreted protein n=1 Tax=Ensete ventricosum TaxID=4639 RepID=A0AAV8S0V5_ENSVE|nr:hypothetical protein OPV22_003509 [Ensete ventricosum]
MWFVLLVLSDNRRALPPHFHPAVGVVSDGVDARRHRSSANRLRGERKEHETSRGRVDSLVWVPLSPELGKQFRFNSVTRFEYSCSKPELTQFLFSFQVHRAKTTTIRIGVGIVESTSMKVFCLVRSHGQRGVKDHAHRLLFLSLFACDSLSISLSTLSDQEKLTLSPPFSSHALTSHASPGSNLLCCMLWEV